MSACLGTGMTTKKLKEQDPVEAHHADSFYLFIYLFYLLYLFIILI